MGKNQHVVKHNDGWAVKGEGNGRKTAVVETQAEAIKIAREIYTEIKALTIEME